MSPGGGDDSGGGDDGDGGAAAIPDASAAMAIRTLLMWLQQGDMMVPGVLTEVTAALWSMTMNPVLARLVCVAGPRRCPQRHGGACTAKSRRLLCPPRPQPPPSTRMHPPRPTLPACNCANWRAGWRRLSAVAAHR